MKKRCVFLILPLLLIFLSGFDSDSANIIEKQLETAENSGITEGLSERTKDTLEEIGISGIKIDFLENLSFSDIFDLLKSGFIKQIKEPVYAMAAIIASGIICAAAECFYDEFSQSKNLINAVSAISAASCILLPMKNVISFSGEVINECSDFIFSFVPVYSYAVTSAGYISSAVGFRSLMLGASAVISNLANEIVVPLICIYFALCIAGSVSDLNIEKIAKSVKSFAVWVLTLSVTVFSGIMGLGTIVSSSADGAFSKTAKFLIGSSIPVAGSVVSDALSTLKGCMVVAKNLLGVYAIVVIAAIFLPPIISLVCWRICLSFSEGINSVLGNKNLSGILSSASCVMGIMLALVSLVAVMFIFSITIMLLTAGGI